MAAATDQQVQQFVNERVRVRSEQIRALLLAMEDDRSAIDSVYERLTTDPTWTDQRTDGPPQLLGPNDILAWNAFLASTIASMRLLPELAVVLKACVRPLQL